MNPAPLPASVPLGVARAWAQRLLGRLERNESALRLAVAGEVRRMAPWVTRLDLLATAHEPGPLLDAIAEAPKVVAVLARAERSIEARLEDGLAVRLEVLEEEAEFGPALVSATGPATHLALLEARARALGLAWRGHVLWEGNTPLTLGEEAEVYERLGLERPAPERRERSLPGHEVQEPVSMVEIRCAAGLHVRPGGGRYPLTDMAARAQREGFVWSLLVVPASEPASVAEAEEALKRWNDDAETTAPGRLALEIGARDAAPPRKDPRLRLVSVDAQSPRSVLEAAAHDARGDALLLRFPPAPPDVGEADDHRLAILKGLAARGAALAVAPPPSHPRPEPALLEAALGVGVPLLLLAQARDLLGIEDLVLSVGMARRAGARREQVLNALDVKAFDAWLAARRAAGGH